VSRQGRLSKTQALIGVVVYFLIGCAVLVVGCARVRSGSPQQEEQQGHAEASKEQAHSRLYRSDPRCPRELLKTGSNVVEVDEQPLDDPEDLPHGQQLKSACTHTYVRTAGLRIRSRALNLLLPLPRPRILSVS
jgi:hypothetical protein